MELAEGIQKLAPWLGQLPIAHKIVLTVAILAVASFLIFVLWIPIHPELPQSTGARQEGDGNPLTIIVNASGAAVDATGRFVQQIDSPAEARRFTNDAEREQLKQVIHKLVSLEFGQAPLPWLLRGYATNPHPQNWHQVIATVANCAPIIDYLQKFLGDFNGDLISRDLDTYKHLYSMTQTRRDLYDALSAMPPPTSQQDKEKLLKIADNFDRLIAQMKLVQKKLANYLTNEESAQ